MPKGRLFTGHALQFDSSKGLGSWTLAPQELRRKMIPMSLKPRKYKERNDLVCLSYNKKVWTLCKKLQSTQKDFVDISYICTRI